MGPIARNLTSVEKWCIKYVCCFCIPLPRHIFITDTEIIEELDIIFKEFQNQPSNSLLKKYLTVDIYESLKFRQTPAGNTLKEVIACGVNNPNCKIGVYAPDRYAYKTYAELMYPITAELQSLSKMYLHPGRPDFGPHGAFYIMDPEKHCVQSIRFEFSRNLNGYPLTPSMTHENYTKFQTEVITNLHSFRGTFQGTYFRYKEIPEQLKGRLIELKLMIPNENDCLEAGNIWRHWPNGRGIFISDELDWVIWINIEDHFKVIVTHEYGEFYKCYDRAIQVHEKLHKRFDFMFDEEFGYITICPTKLGNAFRGGIELRLPLLKAYPNEIKKLLSDYHLVARTVENEDVPSDFNGIFVIWSTKTLAIDEFESVQPLYEGVVRLLLVEDELRDIEYKKSLSTSRLRDEYDPDVAKQIIKRKFPNSDKQVGFTV